MKRLFVIIIVQILLLNIGLAQFIAQNRYLVYANHIIDTRSLQVAYDMPDSIILTHSSYFPPYLYVSDSTRVYVFNVSQSTIQLDTVLDLHSSHSDYRIFTLKNSPSTTTCYAAGQIRPDKISIYRIINNSVTNSQAYNDYVLGPVFPLSDSIGCITMTQIQTSIGSTDIEIRYLIIGPNNVIKDTSQSYAISGFWSSVQVVKTFLSPKLDYFGIITNENETILLKTIFNKDNNAQDQITFTGSPFDITFSPKGKYMYYTLENGLFKYDFEQDTSLEILTSTTISNIISVNSNLWISHTSQPNLDIIYNPDDQTNIYYKPNAITFANNSRIGHLFQQYPATLFDYNLRIINEQPPIIEFTIDSNFIAKNIAWQEPNFIIWTANDSIILDTTFQGQNHFVKTFATIHGETKISATAYFITNNDTLTQTTHHLITIQTYQIPDLLQDTLIISCDTPNYQFNFTNLVEGHDSIVWLVNGQKIDTMFNVSSGTLKGPGNYHVIVYYPGFSIQDSIKLFYQNTTFTRDQIKIFVNGQEYSPSNHLFCTQSGTIKFDITLPDSSLCSNNFIYHYFFGDGSNLRTLNPQIDHKYNQSGDYLVTIFIQNQDTRYNYAFHFPITVSINPVDSAPGFINLNVNQRLTLQIDKDFKINYYNWLKQNFLLIDLDTTIYNSSSFLINIPDEGYRGENKLKAFFADLSSDNAQNLKITLKNYTGDTLTVKNFYPLPYTYKIFFGLPKIYRPNLTTYLTPESFYTYLWSNSASLTFNQILNSSQNTPTYHRYEKYMQDNALLDLPHFWLNSAALKTPRALTFNSQVGNRLGLTFSIDTSVAHSHVSIGQVGLVFYPHFVPGQFLFSWSSTAPILSQTDSSVTVAAAFPNKYEVTLTVKDQFGCKYKSTVDLYVIDSLSARIPNAFTPNGDGINDTWDLQIFFLKQLTANPPIPVAVTIWNKNGKIVKRFLVNNIPQWDGTDNFGRKLPPGPYWYVITINKKIVAKGTVTIVY